MEDKDLHNIDLSPIELVFDHTYGFDVDAYGRKRQKEGSILSLWGDALGIDIQAEKTDYDLLCPWESVTLRLDYKEVERLKNFLEDCLNKFQEVNNFCYDYYHKEND